MEMEMDGGAPEHAKSRARVTAWVSRWHWDEAAREAREAGYAAAREAAREAGGFDPREQKGERNAE